jgi:hypothetical protein
LVNKLSDSDLKKNRITYFRPSRRTWCIDAFVTRGAR